MVSKYQKSKPSGYTIYVIQRCSETGMQYSAGAFTKFGSGWKELDAEAKAMYNAEAKRQTKIMVERRAAEISKPVTFFEVLALQSNKRKAITVYDDSVNPAGNDGPCSSGLESSGLSQPAMKRILVGDDEGDCEAFVEYNPSMDHEQMVDVEADITSEDLWKNAIEAYGDLEGVFKRYVFVISCTPAIFAQGWKKASNNQVNRPVEIALTIFSVANGLESVWSHSFISPGTLPATATCDAEESGRDVHGIPLPGQFSEDCVSFYDNGFKSSNDYYGIYEQILQLIGYDEVCNDALPPLFSTSAKVAGDEACLRWLLIQADIQAEEEGLPKLPDLRFSTLEIFSRLAVYYLGQELPDKVQCSTASSICAIFVGNAGRYCRNCLPHLSCTYHGDHNPTKVCALGSAREACYIVLMVMKTLFKLPHMDDRFVYLGRSFSTNEI